MTVKMLKEIPPKVYNEVEKSVVLRAGSTVVRFGLKFF